MFRATGESVKRVSVGLLQLLSNASRPPIPSLPLASPGILRGGLLRSRALEIPESLLATVTKFSRIGARTVTTQRQVAEDAGVKAVQQWEQALLANKRITQLAAWAFRVGQNAARQIASRRRSTLEVDLLSVHAAAREDDQPPPALADQGRVNVAGLLEEHAHLLRGRQAEVVRKLSERGMSFHQAARELGMHRCNVKRTFRSALKRLRAMRG
jgi:DNA-directed RNA polymerase specialized sigma24 family protein